MPPPRVPAEPLVPVTSGTAWIDDLTDEQCMEIFWLYVEPPEPFLESHPPALLGEAMRYALRAIARRTGAGQEPGNA